MTKWLVEIPEGMDVVAVAKQLTCAVDDMVYAFTKCKGAKVVRLKADEVIGKASEFQTTFDKEQAMQLSNACDAQSIAEQRAVALELALSRAATIIDDIEAAVGSKRLRKALKAIEEAVHGR